MLPASIVWGIAMDMVLEDVARWHERHCSPGHFFLNCARVVRAVTFGWSQFPEEAQDQMIREYNQVTARGWLQLD